MNFLAEWVKEADNILNSFYNLNISTDRRVTWPITVKKIADPLRTVHITSSKIILKDAPLGDAWKPHILQANLMIYFQDKNLGMSTKNNNSELFSVFLTALLLKCSPELSGLKDAYISKFRKRQKMDRNARAIFSLYVNYCTIPKKAWLPDLQKLLQHDIPSVIRNLSDILHNNVWAHFSSFDLEVMKTILSKGTTNGRELLQYISCTRSRLYNSLKKVQTTVNNRLVPNFSYFKLNVLQVNKTTIPEKRLIDLMEFYASRSLFSDVDYYNIAFRLPITVISRFIAKLYQADAAADLCIFRNNSVEIGICLDSYDPNQAIWQPMYKQKMHCDQKTYIRSPYSKFHSGSSKITLSSAELQFFEYILRTNDDSLTPKKEISLPHQKQRLLIKKLKKKGFMSEITTLRKPNAIRTYVFLLSLKDYTPLETETFSPEDTISNFLNAELYVKQKFAESATLTEIKKEPWPYITIEYGIQLQLKNGKIKTSLIAQLKITAQPDDIIQLMRYRQDIEFMGIEKNPSGSSLNLLSNYYRNGVYEISDNIIVQISNLFDK